MKSNTIILGLIFSLLAFSFRAQTTKHKTGGIKPLRVTVTGRLLQTFTYCGGAAPTDEMLKELQKPAAYPGKVFYVRKGKVNSTKAEIVKSFTTDAKGEFSFQLTPGTYCIIQKEQVKKLDPADFKKDQYTVVDENCLKEWWVKPYYVIEVKQKNITIPDFMIHQPCFVLGDVPCLSYDGPLPP